MSLLVNLWLGLTLLLLAWFCVGTLPKAWAWWRSGKLPTRLLLAFHVCVLAFVLLWPLLIVWLMGYGTYRHFRPAAEEEPA